MKSNGLKFDGKGTLFACEGSDEGVAGGRPLDVKTKTRTVIADKYMGKALQRAERPGDRHEGASLLLGSALPGTEPRELEHRAVYRIDTDRKVVEVTHDVEKPNGIALSPDGKTCTWPTTTMAPTASIRTTRRSAGRHEDFMRSARCRWARERPAKDARRFGDTPGCDGMTVDSKGHIYLTARQSEAPRRHGH